MNDASGSNEAAPARRPPRVDVVVVDPQKRARAMLMAAAARGALAALAATFVAGLAARAFLPWYRTPRVDDAQPCNCRAPIRDALDRALTEALLVEVVVALLAFLVVSVVAFTIARRRAAGASSGK